jgi:hypothetical protein
MNARIRSGVMTKISRGPARGARAPTYRSESLLMEM